MNQRQDPDKTLLRAVEQGNASQVLTLLQAGAEVGTTSANGRTPLMVAVLFGHGEIARSLLDAGADPNQVTSSEENPQRTALLVAVHNGRTDLVELLAQRGADVNGPGHPGTSIVQVARRLSERPFKQAEMREAVRLLEGRSRPVAGAEPSAV